MDAKSKANFINSIAGGQEIACPECGTSNKADSKFCISCGKDLSTTAGTNNAPAFAPATEPVEEAKAAPVKYVEPVNVFAQGLPDWSIEPPQVMVRRH